MRILVVIANYGIKNVKYAQRLIQEYRSMSFDVDIFVLSESQKDYGSDATVLVGLPTKDPWSLPFAHKKLFAENVDKYDVFIYTEDDVLIREANILAFLQASASLGDNFLPGFVRYESHPNGKKYYLDIHGPYHWVPGSIGQSGDYIFAKLSNEHSACYVLTQRQLRKAISSGGFLVPPHSGRYDLICTAGTDPYTQCGFTKVICFSHFHEFELHHLPNAYSNRIGMIQKDCAILDEDGCKAQLEALLDILAQKRTKEELFITEKSLSTLEWDKDYHEPCRHDILQFIPAGAQDILSVGCGWGATEAHLIENGKRVVAIPIDSVIGRLAEEQGVDVLPPVFEQAFEMLAGRKFDVIILSEVLQHLPDPVEILSKLGPLLNDQGLLIGSVQNLGLIRRLLGRLLAKNNKKFRINGDFNKTNLNLTNASKMSKWLRTSSLYPLEMQYQNHATSSSLLWLLPYLPGGLASSNVVFVAERRMSV
jgi:2-polyprenyl-3-methyl-5-hydroxy-6-metoxy-1,4-benzoquinol methylase